MPDTMDNWWFENAEQALMWSADVLRMRRLPRISPLWREMVREKVEEVVPRGGKALLPRDAEDRLALALAVDSKVGELAVEAGWLLRLYGWGDWADEARLRGSLALQEKLRQQGIRARICHRYSFRQLGLQLGCDHKTAAKRVGEALIMLEEKLVGMGLVPLRQGERVMPDKVKNVVYLADFAAKH